MRRTVACIGVAVVALGLGLACSSEQPEAEGARGDAAPRKPHAVLLILDELPGDSLLDRREHIDPVRYPSFAALAADSVWFRNAYSSYDSTTKAVPLILDGRAPRPGLSPTRAEHPRSLFDMFAREGYGIVTSEEASALCPPSLCRGGQARPPAIIPNLLRGRPERFSRWLASIRGGGRPQLWVKHLLLPHGPYMHLPSGARTRTRPRDLLPGMNTVPGFHDEFLTRHNEQRYLLQLGYTDRLLGRLLRRLRQQGIYDDTLIVVTADHGYAWEAGVSTRRSVNPANVEELAPVPLLVKRPGRARGSVDGAYVRTLDVASTVADVLGYELGYRDDGDSAFGPKVQRRRTVSLTVRDFSSVVSVPGRRWQALRRRVVHRRLSDFGSGDRAALFAGIGPNRGLVGRDVDELARAAGGEVRGSLAQGDLFASVRRARGVIPTQIAGDLRGGTAGARRELAVAVNGRIEAVGRSFYLEGDRTEHFAFNVPEPALRDGANRIEVFEVVAGTRLRSLVRR
jgi:hypothetical protein